MRKAVRLAAFALVASCASVAFAQEPVRLSLADAQARALETSHRLAETQARRDVAQAVVDARAAAEKPTVSALAGYMRTNHVPEFVIPSLIRPSQVIYPDIPDNYRTRLDLQWPIYTGGRTDALERAARAEAAAVDAALGVARADLRLETARAFWAVVTAAESVRVLGQGVARAQAHVADVRARFDAGFVPPNEIASAEAQESRERMLLIEARNQQQATAADLARLVGLDPGNAIEPSASLSGAAQQLPAIDALIASARQGRDERVGLQRRIDAAEQQRLAAAAGRYPTVAVAGGYDYARPNARIFPRAEQWKDSWDAAVNLTWPLWDGGRTSADVAQAEGGARAARERLAEFDSVLGVDVRQRALDIESGRAAVDAATDAVRAAAEARRVVGERYRAGVISQIEVLDADYALLQAELDRTRTLANLRLAEARLARAIGR
jgi:outer membrane protein TolC